jgi:protein-S-isoprenylcysteine O-methyltransferase Ste14
MTKMVSIQPRPRSLTYRTTIFGFGVVAYGLGVGALVGLILVMLGVASFTGGPIGKLPLGVALLLDLGLLVAFALQHSVMARPSFKARWTQIVPASAERSTFLLATALALIPLLLFWQPMPEVVWSVEGPVLRGLLLAVAVAGWAYLLAASFAINHFELFGLQQVYQALRNRPLTQPPFQARWMYRFDRHPIMTGILIGIWVTPTMTVDHLVFAIGTTVYVCVGVFFEERSLRQQLGSAYEEYCERVRTIVPTFKRGRSRDARVVSVRGERNSS